MYQQSGAWDDLDRLSKPVNILKQSELCETICPDTLIHGDCLEVMKHIADGSIDMILADLPYGTTKCSWDIVIPFEPLWEAYKRVIKPGGAIVLFGSEPFSSHLRMSNIKWFKYDWIWVKNVPTGMPTAKYMPMKYHETVSVFCSGKTIYNPVGIPRVWKTQKLIDKIKRRERPTAHGYNDKVGQWKDYSPDIKNPSTVLEFSVVPNAGGGKLHPTQKPVALFEYLIRTYSNPGELVLDNTMGERDVAACLPEYRSPLHRHRDGR